MHNKKENPLQFELFPVTAVSEKSTMQLQFEEFHRQNPHVLQAIIKIAKELKRRNFKHCGIGMIFERLRWMYAIQTEGDDYSLNNNYRSFYARLVMKIEPELEDFFTLRKMANDYDPDLDALRVQY